jgi:hypothetical protein
LSFCPWNLFLTSFNSFMLSSSCVDELITYSIVLTFL